MKLDDDAIVFYEQNGWYISDYILDAATIAGCIDAAERIYACDYDHRQAWSTSPLFKTFDVPYAPRAELRVDQFPSFHNDVVRSIVHSPVIAEISAQLLRTKEIRYYKDILIGAPARRDHSAIGWHMDVSYWPTCIPERMITVYVPLQTRNKSNGTLLMISGSQRWQTRFNITAGFDDLDKLKRRFEAAGKRVELHDLPHRPGQVSFHSSLVVHATYPNTTPEFQHSIVFGHQARENRFVPSPLKRLNRSLVVNLNDEIGPLTSEGEPDVKNDDFYPVLYSSQEVS